MSRDCFFVFLKYALLSQKQKYEMILQNKQL